MKVFLVGMPGSGKSTIGKQLSSELRMPFIDLDREIEAVEGKSISEIFAEDGEDHFRVVESRLLKEFAYSDKRFVMATGGGAPCFFNGMDILNENGITVFLDTPLDTIGSRLQRKTNRPLLEQEKSKEEKLRELYTRRLSTYSQAKIHVGDPTLQNVTQALESISDQ